MDEDSLARLVEKGAAHKACCRTHALISDGEIAMEKVKKQQLAVGNSYGPEAAETLGVPSEQPAISPE